MYIVASNENLLQKVDMSNVVHKRRTLSYSGDKIVKSLGQSPHDYSSVLKGGK